MGAPLTKLRRKRIRIHRQLDKLEPMLAGYRTKLAELEAQIQALGPELPLPIRHGTYQPTPDFAAMAILREAQEPLPLRAITTGALAMRRAPDRRIFRLTRIRLAQLFGRSMRGG